jgi:hypothetical protein
MLAIYYGPTCASKALVAAFGGFIHVDKTSNSFAYLVLRGVGGLSLSWRRTTRLLLVDKQA